MPVLEPSPVLEPVQLHTSDSEEDAVAVVLHDTQLALPEVSVPTGHGDDEMSDELVVDLPPDVELEEEEAVAFDNVSADGINTSNEVGNTFFAFGHI